nr:rhomboid family intramembrane serine protease [Ardenticatena sp.]
MNTSSSLPPRPVRIFPVHTVWLTYLLILINLGVFLVETVLGLLWGAGLNATTNTCMLLFFGAKFNLFIQAGQYWRLITPIFLHIGIFHLLVNMVALRILGRDIESLFGTGRFLIIYLVSGVGGSIASMLFNSSISAGASGAIFGLIGAEAVFLYINRHSLGLISDERLQSLLGIIIINLLFGIAMPGIDNAGHIGGLLTGAFVGWLLSPRYAETPIILPDGETAIAIHDTNTWRRSLPKVAAFVLVLAMLVPLLSRYAPIDQIDIRIARACGYTVFMR